MEQITFEINNNSDAKLLIELAKRLGVRVSKISRKKSIGDAGLLRKIEKGVDVSNFGNPSEWQKEVRKDRPLNILK